jgi:flavin-dependent dehydrogenase
MSDYLVIGAGPAGVAAAIVLAEAGASVRVVGRARSAREQFGESLSPGCAGLLRQLGLWRSFQVDGHLPCYAHRSAWGSDDVAVHDLIRDPRGHGWHIDRAAFERRMLERARALGVTVTSGLIDGEWSFEQDHWSGSLRHERGRIWARRVIDASGKASWFARRQCVNRLVYSRQVALIAIMETGVTSDDTSSLVETVPEGWWYSAPVPGMRLAVALFTDARGVADLRQHGAFLRLLHRSRHTRARVEAEGARLLDTPRFVDAGSGRLKRVFGPGWLAVGDAAMNYDPLSAHGITLALRSGIDGARALMADSLDACSAYERRLFGAYQAYHCECERLYRTESRWPGATFWARRGRGAMNSSAA